MTLRHTHTRTCAWLSRAHPRAQIDAGIKGVAPGYATQQFLQHKVRQCKFWGGLALAGLAVAAHLFDQLCLSVVGTTLATTSLVIIVGAVLQTSRQVRALCVCVCVCVAGGQQSGGRQRRLREWSAARRSLSAVSIWCAHST
jgi:hypothetical protein